MKKFLIKIVDNKLISIIHLKENGENKEIYNIFNIFLYKNFYQLPPRDGYFLIKIWDSCYMSNNLYYIDCKSLTNKLNIIRNSDILYISKHKECRLTKILAIEIDDIDISNKLNKVINRIYGYYMSANGIIILYNYLINKKINNDSLKSKVKIIDYDIVEKSYYGESLIN